MNTWLDQTAAKIVKLNKELSDLKKRYDISTIDTGDVLEALRELTNRATEAAERSGRAAAEAITTAKAVLISRMDPTSRRLVDCAEEWKTAAETAAKAAQESSELVHEVLLTARTLAASQEDAATIQASMRSVLIAIRVAEAAAAATRLAQSVTAFASSTTITEH